MRFSGIHYQTSRPLDPSRIRPYHVTAPAGPGRCACCLLLCDVAHGMAATTVARRGVVGMDLPSDICLAAPGRALTSVRSGESLTNPPVRVPRRLRIGGVRAGGSAAGGRFFSRSDIDLVGQDPRLSQTWLAATAGGGFSASAFDISAESKRALDPPKFKPHEALEQLRTRSRVLHKSPHVVPEQRPRTTATVRPRDRAQHKRKKGKNTEAAALTSRPYAPPRPRTTNVSPQRRPTSAAHRPTSAAPKPIIKGRVPWMSLIGVEGDRPTMYETQPSRATGPILQPGSRRRPTQRRGDSARRRGRPSTAAPGTGHKGSRSERPASSFNSEGPFVTRPSTAPSGGRSKTQPEESPSSPDRTRIEADLSYSRALVATAGDVMIASGAVGANCVVEPTALSADTGSSVIE